jgi:hypothetical protein
VGEWYYIGHYGQLGPLTREQIDELITGGVIARDTFVWRTGMTDWLYAERCPDLSASFVTADPFNAPPPRPGFPAPAGPGLDIRTGPPMPVAGAYDYSLHQPNAFYPSVGGLKSDRSRTAAGVLQIILPGVGRMYLGYLAYGVIQLLLTLICGVGWIWSAIDGIVMLSGGVRLDGYGRQLGD